MIHSAIQRLQLRGLLHASRVSVGHRLNLPVCRGYADKKLPPNSNDSSSSAPASDYIPSQTPLSKSEPSSHPLPEQQGFQQHLCPLAQSAACKVIELMMRQELDAFIGAAWGECSPNRKGVLYLVVVIYLTTLT